MIIDGSKVILSNLCELNESKLWFSDYTSMNWRKMKKHLINLINQSSKTLSNIVIYLYFWKQLSSPKYRTNSIFCFKQMVWVFKKASNNYCLLSMATNIISFKCSHARYRGKNFQGICRNQFKWGRWGGTRSSYDSVSQWQLRLWY